MSKPNMLGTISSSVIAEMLRAKFVDKHFDKMIGQLTSMSIERLKTDDSTYVYRTVWYGTT